MSCSSVANIRIEPVNVSWEIEQQTCVETVADVSSSLNNKYFTIRSSADAKFHVWYNVAAAGVDPAPANSTGIPVAISANASASAVATATQVAVDANANFKASLYDATNVIITAMTPADVTDSVDFNTTFEIETIQEGGIIDLGLLDGDVEVSFEEQTFEVFAHQTGTTLRADLRQGVSAEVSLTLKESHNTLRKEIFAKASGGMHTPSGGTEVFGWGNSRQGLNTVVQSRRLVMHPVALVSGDKSRDLCFWKSYPMPESLTFSGENPEMISVTFKSYLDDTKPSGINLFGFGDWSQSEYIP